MMTLGGIDLGRVRVGTERCASFRLTNACSSVVVVAAPRVVVVGEGNEGEDNAFRASLLLLPPPHAAVLSAGQSVDVRVCFAPPSARVFRATVEVPIGAIGGTARVSVQGEGTAVGSTSLSTSTSSSSVSASAEERVRRCTEALAELGRFAAALKKEVGELSVSLSHASPASRHVSWGDDDDDADGGGGDDGRLPHTPMRASSSSQQGELEQRILRLERALQTVTSKLDATIRHHQQQDSTLPLEEEGGAIAAAVAATPLPRALSREDAELLDAMGAAPGGPPKSTGKTPARWRDFVTGDAAEMESSPTRL